MKDRRSEPADGWKTLKEWPELILERLADEGVARITLNRPVSRGRSRKAISNIPATAAIPSSPKLEGSGIGTVTTPEST